MRSLGFHLVLIWSMLIECSDSVIKDSSFIKLSTANISSERSGGLRQMEIKQVLFWLSITSITFRLIYFN